MYIGSQIKRIRKLRGITQKQLGLLVGFSETTADVRIAQYESGARTPKDIVLNLIAKNLGVSRLALDVFSTDADNALLPILFMLEDIYGIRAGKTDEKVFLSFDCSLKKKYPNLFDDLLAWQEKNEQLSNNQISEEEYNEWRYNYPNLFL